MSTLSGKTVYLVIGNPRAGTSAISHFLSNCGVDFGDPANFIDTSIHKHNPIFFELEWVNRLNEEVMSLLGGKWGQDFLPDETDFDHPTLALLREKGLKRLAELAPEATTIGLKDPRFCFTFPFWNRLLRDAGADLRLVWSIRSIHATLESNQRLNGWPVQHGWSFLIQSMLCCRYFTRNERVVFLDYDEMVSHPEPFAERALGLLEFTSVPVSTAISHVETSLRHHEVTRSSGSNLLDRYDADLRAGSLSPEAYLVYRDTYCLARETLVPPAHAGLPRPTEMVLRTGLNQANSSLAKAHGQLERSQGLLDEVAVGVKSANSILNQTHSELAAQIRSLGGMGQVLQSLLDGQRTLETTLAVKHTAELNRAEQHVQRRLRTLSTNHAAQVRRLNRQAETLSAELAQSRQSHADEVALLRKQLTELQMELILVRPGSRRVA